MTRISNVGPKQLQYLMVSIQGLHTGHSDTVVARSTRILPLLRRFSEPGLQSENHCGPSIRQR